MARRAADGMHRASLDKLSDVTNNLYKVKGETQKHDTNK